MNDCNSAIAKCNYNQTACDFDCMHAKVRNNIYLLTYILIYLDYRVTITN